LLWSQVYRDGNVDSTRILSVTLGHEIVAVGLGSGHGEISVMLTRGFKELRGGDKKVNPDQSLALTQIVTFEIS
jgi:hypothetical protein